MTISRLYSIVFVCLGLLIQAGCDNGGEQKPQIVGEVTHIPPASPYRAPTIRPVRPRSVDEYAPSGWIPPKSCEKQWKAIVIHHSGSDNGNAASIDDWHRNGKGWQGVGYDFVIGNGSKNPDGQVEVTFRWQQQIPGAHVGGTPNNWANVDGIGICLIGDFNKTSPSYRQMQSLVQLVKFLQKRYEISTDSIYGHRETPGYTNGTDCPGRNFSMYRLRQML